MREKYQKPPWLEDLDEAHIENERLEAELKKLNIIIELFYKQAEAISNEDDAAELISDLQFEGRQYFKNKDEG